LGLTTTHLPVCIALSHLQTSPPQLKLWVHSVSTLHDGSVKVQWLLTHVAPSALHLHSESMVQKPSDPGAFCNGAVGQQN
jgi:hypothetical protein